MDSSKNPSRPTASGSGPAGAGQSQGATASGSASRKRRNHRGGKKKKQRRKSFVLGPNDMAPDATQEGGEGFFRNSNMSASSLESEALLDHREQQHFLRPRRPSIMALPASMTQSQPAPSPGTTRHRARILGDSDEDDEAAPLLAHSMHRRAETISGGYGSNDASQRRSRPHSSRRASSRASSKRHLNNPFASSNHTVSYNVNYPPSVPGSPRMRPSDRMEMSFGDLLLREDAESGRNSPRRGSADQDAEEGLAHKPSPIERRHTIALQAEEDVCFPQEGAFSEIADDELRSQYPDSTHMRARRRRERGPDLAILEDWSRIEKEGRSDERRAKKITEPQLINGRLRPVNRGWYKTEDDAPYRFTYFNEEFQSTIHSQTISELAQPGGTFRELFIPDPPLLSDSSDEEEETDQGLAPSSQDMSGFHNGESKAPTRQPSLSNAAQGVPEHRRERTMSPSTDRPGTFGSGAGDLHSSQRHSSGEQTPAENRSPRRVRTPQPQKQAAPKPPRYGDRPVWWLDILSPTEAEMKVLSKAFGIHPLTAEDIMVQEQREKVELFRHYFFVSYRTFDQDHTSENFLEPVNMYVVVFREFVLSFHFNMTPHPANVRRRIRQLRDYLILSSDWISYAIIDDITDAFGPLIQSIEDEVDDIDDEVLRLHSVNDMTFYKESKKREGEKSETGDAEPMSGRDMLRRVGDCRKKVMSLYRLLSNKADVIKGLAKRCNEHWEVAPRSEIGLYLGDIQDHIVTMTSNLSHYEMILARAHNNYLAQINIRMNERQEQTADVLGKLTVLGTIVLPMNIITGLWGMNVWVPGQEYEGSLTWFYCITAGLLVFGVACYMIAKRVYGIV